MASMWTLWRWKFIWFHLSASVQFPSNWIWAWAFRREIDIDQRATERQHWWTYPRVGVRSGFQMLLRIRPHTAYIRFPPHLYFNIVAWWQLLIFAKNYDELCANAPVLRSRILVLIHIVLAVHFRAPEIIIVLQITVYVDYTVCKQVF
jgi:uncharacterized membrane protein YwzB